MGRSRRIAVVVAVMVVFASLFTPVAQAASPLGMERFVVSIGKASAGARDNWVRLGSYSFNASNNTVTETHWHWTQRRRESRSSTGVRAAGCVARNCIVRTAYGFQSSSAPESLSGTYTVTGDQVRITWTGNGWEEWNLTEPVAGKLAKLTFRASSFGATHGYGYGSDAEWSTRASMGVIAGYDHNQLEHRYHLWKTDGGSPYVDQGSGSPFWMRNWDRCESARCVGGLNTSSQTSYYISMPSTTSTGRRDTLEHWRHTLADGRGDHCYTGNSHVKPMLQIIDSDGGFHGWVGVEASLNQTVPSEGTSGDDIGVFVIANH
jgi:hypothetical protein